MGMKDATGQIRLKCPVCDSGDFEMQESRQNGRYVLHFHDAHSIFNPG